LRRLIASEWSIGCSQWCPEVSIDQWSHGDGEQEDPDPHLKVPKREIFDRSDSPDFYTIKSSCVGDLVVKILTYYFNF
jgi:hypothetical protein